LGEKCEKGKRKRGKWKRKRKKVEWLSESG
jgi:hypothetical protein